MKQVVIERFGGPECLAVREVDTPEPGSGQVRVRLTSIGMNHAELMSRRGEYRLASGDPPFTPGLEGGGVIEAVGEGVDGGRLEERVILSPDAPRLGVGPMAGTYRSHFICDASRAISAPDAVPEDQLGAIWLAYLTAWGCLVWKQRLRPGQIVLLPAASSSVALAAAQIVKHLGATAIGLTRSKHKAQRLAALEAAVYDHLVVTHEPDGAMRAWHRDLRRITDGRGVDVCFDPVAGGAYLDSEIKSLADDGCIWVYGLLARREAPTGASVDIDVTPLIRKRAAIRGWSLSELIRAGREAWQAGCDGILEGFALGHYRQHVDATFPLDDVQRAHTVMERGEHVGKLVLVP